MSKHLAGWRIRVGDQYYGLVRGGLAWVDNVDEAYTYTDYEQVSRVYRNACDSVEFLKHKTAITLEVVWQPM